MSTWARLCKEASFAWLEYGFKEMKIVDMLHTDNIASNTILEKME
jgi:RimJ/RimL family protein N-acetyltransferase